MRKRKFSAPLPEEKKQKRRKRRKRLFIALGIIVVIFVGFRIALPYIVLHYVNKVLGNLDEYYGHVEDIDIRLYRGAYVIKDIKLMKKIKGDSTETGASQVDTIPFFDCKRVDLSIQWKALFQGSVVGEIDVEKPVVNFVKQQQKGDTEVKKDTADFRQVIRDLMPLKVNRFSVTDGEIHYIDPLSNPKVDIFMHAIDLIATNLTNVEDNSDPLPASLRGRASVYDGNLYVSVKIDPFAGDPTFDATAQLTTLDLKQLNSFMQAYVNFDVERGYMNMYAEFAAKDGLFGGYVKPLIHELDVVEWKKEEGNVWQQMWEGLVDFAAGIFTNKKKDQLGTKVVIEGSFNQPGINVWRAIGLVLRNAFIQALRPSIDATININKLKDTSDKTFLEKIFGGGDKKNKKDKKKKKKKN